VLSLVPATLAAPTILASNAGESSAVNATRTVNANDGFVIFSLPGTTAQKEDDTPYTYVTTGSAYFGQDGPELNIRFATQAGQKFTDGQITAKFDGSRPVIEASGDTSNLVMDRSVDNGLPHLYVSYKHGQAQDYGFSVNFEVDRGYKDGKYAYPQFTSLDGTATTSKCTIAGHTNHFNGVGGGGMNWFGYDVSSGIAEVSAWYTRTSPEISVNSGIIRLGIIGFMQGEPSAQANFDKDGWIAAGFDNDAPYIEGAPQNNEAIC